MLSFAMAFGVMTAIGVGAEEVKAEESGSLTMLDTDGNPVDGWIPAAKYNSSEVLVPDKYQFKYGESETACTAGELKLYRCNYRENDEHYDATEVTGGITQVGEYVNINVASDKAGEYEVRATVEGTTYVKNIFIGVDHGAGLYSTYTTGEKNTLSGDVWNKTFTKDESFYLFVPSAATTDVKVEARYEGFENDWITVGTDTTPLNMTDANVDITWNKDDDPEAGELYTITVGDSESATINFKATINYKDADNLHWTQELNVNIHYQTTGYALMLGDFEQGIYSGDWNTPSKTREIDFRYRSTFYVVMVDAEGNYNRVNLTQTPVTASSDVRILKQQDDGLIQLVVLEDKAEVSLGIDGETLKLKVFDDIRLYKDQSCSQAFSTSDYIIAEDSLEEDWPYGFYTVPYSTESQYVYLKIKDADQISELFVYDCLTDENVDIASSALPAFITKVNNGLYKINTADTGNNGRFNIEITYINTNGRECRIIINGDEAPMPSCLQVKKVWDDDTSDDYRDEAISWLGDACHVFAWYDADDESYTEKSASDLKVVYLGTTAESSGSTEVSGTLTTDPKGHTVFKPNKLGFYKVTLKNGSPDSFVILEYRLPWVGVYSSATASLDKITNKVIMYEQGANPTVYLITSDSKTGYSYANRITSFKSGETTYALASAANSSVVVKNDDGEDLIKATRISDSVVKIETYSNIDYEDGFDVIYTHYDLEEDWEEINNSSLWEESYWCSIYPLATGLFGEIQYPDGPSPLLKGETTECVDPDNVSFKLVQVTADGGEIHSEYINDLSTLAVYSYSDTEGKIGSLAPTSNYSIKKANGVITFSSKVEATYAFVINNNKDNYFTLHACLEAVSFFTTNTRPKDGELITSQIKTYTYNTNSSNNTKVYLLGYYLPKDGDAAPWVCDMEDVQIVVTDASGVQHNNWVSLGTTFDNMNGSVKYGMGRELIISSAVTESFTAEFSFAYAYPDLPQTPLDRMVIKLDVTVVKPSSGGGGGYTPSPAPSGDPTPAPAVPETPEVPAEPVIENKTETKEDGTVVETEKITDVDGSTKETITETKTDGTVVETVQEVAADGATVESVKETAVDGSSVETVKEVAVDGTTTDTVIETAADGAVVETKTEVAVDGSTTESIKEVAADGKSSAAVEVKKDENGKVTESVVTVESEAKGNKLTVDMNTISDMISKNDSATTKNTTVVLTANDKSGEEKYTVEVDAKDLKAGAKLQVYALDKNGNPVIVDQSKNSVKVTKDGDVKLNISGTGDFTVVTPAEAKKIEKAIEKSVKPAKTNVTVKEGAKTTFKLDDGCAKGNIAKITYSSSNANIKVSKSGKITVKSAGNATVTATVTLANGKTKTIKMKVKSK